MTKLRISSLIYKNVHFSLNFITDTSISPLGHSSIRRSNFILRLPRYILYFTFLQPGHNSLLFLLTARFTEKTLSQQSLIAYTRGIISCSAEGTPSPQISWSKQGGKSLNQKRFSQLPSGSLQVNHVEPEDNGTYICTMKQNKGPRRVTHTDKTIDVLVRSKQRIGVIKTIGLIISTLHPVLKLTIKSTKQCNYWVTFVKLIIISLFYLSSKQSNWWFSRVDHTNKYKIENIQ